MPRVTGRAMSMVVKTGRRMHSSGRVITATDTLVAPIEPGGASRRTLRETDRLRRWRGLNRNRDAAGELAGAADDDRVARVHAFDHFNEIAAANAQIDDDLDGFIVF